MLPISNHDLAPFTSLARNNTPINAMSILHKLYRQKTRKTYNLLASITIIINIVHPIHSNCRPELIVILKIFCLASRSYTAAKILSQPAITQIANSRTVSQSIVLEIFFLSVVHLMSIIK